jgi:choline dehydrogenase-like flavoprotein
MGHPHSAVTDSWGRVHAVPWLRVADSSLFPDALESHPYLTVMALADRVAEGIRADAPAMVADRFALGSRAGGAIPAATRP